ncbi:hypothetical protein [Rhodococcus daqingensis]|uniref:Uncharacterized protein n=1 Tax=Rhodococcus daqingensis TaxID=2479363 RepID=A0ABW2S583_9NOCA
MTQIASWWDGLELWVIGLPFIPQLILVMAVLMPLAIGIASGIDLLLARIFVLLGRDSVADATPADGAR